MTKKPISKKRRRGLFPDPPQKHFYRALGRLVYRYAQLEAEAYDTLLDYAYTAESTTRAITGGMRLADILGAIRRLARLHSYTRLHTEADLDDIFQQINLISQFRDRLVHRFPNVMTELIASNNLASYKLLEDIEEITFTVSDILDASLDLEYLCMRLKLPRQARDSRLTMGDEVWLKYARHFQKPWLYKPRALKNPLRPSRTKSQRPKPPPPPSRK